MRILNVIVTHCKTGVCIIESFGVFEEQLSNEVVEQAEECYLNHCELLKFGEETNCTREEQQIRDSFRDEASETLEDGYMNLGESTVSLVWSDI